MKYIKLFENFMESKEYSPFGEPIKDRNLFDYVYHLADPKFRDFIQSNGILPTGGNWANAYGNEKVKAVFAANTKEPEEWFDAGYDWDVWAINTKNITNKWYIDVNGPMGKNVFIATPDPIPISSLILIHKGDGTNIENKGLRKFILGSVTNHKLLKDKRRYMKLPS